MNRILVIIILLTFSFPAFSQFGVFGGVRTGWATSKTFNRFKQTFNSYLTDVTEKPLGSFGPSIGYGFGTDYEVGGLLVGFRANTIASTARIKYTDNAKRHFDFDQFLTVTYFGIGNNSESSFYGLTFGLAAGNDKITSYFEYSDGTTSYGSEKYLNGIYDAIHMSGAITAQGGVAITDNVLVYGLAELIFGNIPDAFGCLYDDHHHRSLDPFTEYPTGLPLDYEEYMELMGSFDYGVEDYVKADFSGLRFEIGLRIQFGNEIGE